jgi:hypothetical protein
MHTQRVTTIALAVGGTLAVLPAYAQLAPYVGSDLIVSSSTYTDPGFAAGTALPYSSTFTGSTVNATAGSAFCTTANCSGNVWTNATADANFGLTSSITLSAVNTTSGATDASVNVTALAASLGLNVATSFSSKSELALNFTPDGSGVTFMAYNTSTLGELDVSNSNSYSGSEAGNTDTQTATARAVIQFNLATNAVQQTISGAYSGNNGRAAILGANGSYYTVGNAGNGSGGTAITNGNGVQLMTPGQNNTNVNAIGAYSIAQQGYAADKTAKDSNYRGETIYNGTLYVTKGSGSNGIDTVYQVGTAGTLPTAGSGNTGTTTTPVSILPGFSTTLAKATPTAAAPVYHPFGLFFANSTTLYVADEGSGAATDFTTNTFEEGGLQKWSLVNGAWQLDYTLRGSLIGSSYTVNGSGSLAGDALTTTTDGLRNLTGRVNADGTVTLYAVTSTAGSILGDAGADPNRLVAITDTLANTTAPTSEDYTVLQTASLGQVLRGVAIAPVPLPAAAWLLLSGLGGLGTMFRRKRAAAV